MGNDVTLFPQELWCQISSSKGIQWWLKAVPDHKKRKKEKFLNWNIAISDNRMIIWLHRAIANLSILFFCCKDHPMSLPEPYFSIQLKVMLFSWLFSTFIYIYEITRFEKKWKLTWFEHIAIEKHNIYNILFKITTF